MTVSLRPLCVLAALAIPAAVLFAEDRPNPEARRAAPAAPGAAANLDSHFASCLILMNQNEISIAKMAEQRAKSDEVKQLAQKLQKDHQQFLKELERFADNDFRDRGEGEGGQPIDRTRGALPAQQPAVTRAPGEPAQPERPLAGAGQRPQQPARPGAAPGAAVAAAGGDLAQTFMQIRREIADECRASAHRELSSKQGAEFDACFLGMQIGSHWYLIDELKVFEKHASPEFQPVLRKGRETAQAHLDHVKKLMKDVDSRQTADASK